MCLNLQQLSKKQCVIWLLFRIIETYDILTVYILHRTCFTLSFGNSTFFYISKKILTVLHGIFSNLTLYDCLKMHHVVQLHLNTLNTWQEVQQLAMCRGKMWFKNIPRDLGLPPLEKLIYATVLTCFYASHFDGAEIKGSLLKSTFDIKHKNYSIWVLAWPWKSVKSWSKSYAQSFISIPFLQLVWTNVI